APGKRGAFGPADAFSQHHRDDHDGENAGEHAIDSKDVAEPRNRIADAFGCGKELADQDGDQRTADSDARAGDHIGQNAGKEDFQVDVTLATAERTHYVDQKPVDGAHAGSGIKNEREHGKRKDDNRLSGYADAEKNHQQRRKRNQRARIKHRHQRIERVADAHPPTHHDTERHTDDDRRQQAKAERNGADREIVKQISAFDQIYQTRRDLRRRGEKQRVERNDEKYHLPGGEEQHHRQGAQQGAAMTRREGRAR